MARGFDASRKKFKPEIILISGGFDVAVGDMGDYNVTPRGFTFLLRELMKVQGKIVIALEGGYKTSLPDCVYQCLRTLLGDKVEKNFADTQVQETVRDMISKVRGVHSQYWAYFSDSQATSPLVAVGDHTVGGKKPSVQAPSPIVAAVHDHKAPGKTPSVQVTSAVHDHRASEKPPQSK